MNFNPPCKVRVRQPGANPGRVARIEAIVSDQMQRSRVGRQMRKRLQERVDSLSANPVAHAEESDGPFLSKVRTWTGKRCPYVAAWGHDTHVTPWYTPRCELIRQGVACHEEATSPAIRHAVQGGLQCCPKPAVIDSPGRLVQYRDKGQGGWSESNPRSKEGRGDTIECKHVRADLVRVSQHVWPIESR